MTNNIPKISQFYFVTICPYQSLKTGCSYCDMCLWNYSIFIWCQQPNKNTERGKYVNEAVKGSKLFCSTVRAKRRERKTAQQPIAFTEGRIIRGPCWAAGKCHQCPWARCQVPVTDCQLQLKIISESGVRSSMHCFLPPDWGKNAVTIAGPIIIYSPLYKLCWLPSPMSAS